MSPLGNVHPVISGCRRSPVRLADAGRAATTCHGGGIILRSVIHNNDFITVAGHSLILQRKKSVGQGFFPALYAGMMTE